jgi:transcriptional regulator with XRE-family HTH domain
MEYTWEPGVYNASLGARARAARLDQDLRTEYVAAALGVSNVTIYSIEHGHGCRTETLARLAVVLGVSVDYLFGLTEAPTPAPQSPPPGVGGAPSQERTWRYIVRWCPGVSFPPGAHPALVYDLPDLAATLDDVIEACTTYQIDAELYDEEGGAKGWVHADGTSRLH